MERKKRSKGRGWESCYVKKIYGTFGVEMRAYGQKLVQFCKHTHTHTLTRARVSYSSIDVLVCFYCCDPVVFQFEFKRVLVRSNHLSVDSCFCIPMGTGRRDREYVFVDMSVDR